MKQRKGFTLIEVVVVMAIIAILALLIVAAITAARRQATNTQRTGNVKTIEVALESRYSKCGGYIGYTMGGTVPASCATLTTAPTTIAGLRNSLVTEGFLTANQLNVDADAGYTVTGFGGNTFTMTARAFPGNTDTIYTATR